MFEDRTIRIWDDTVGPEVYCRGTSCGRKIVWGETMNAKRMCFTAPAVPVRSEKDEQTGRLILHFAFNDNHWATCPDAPGFKRR